MRINLLFMAGPKRQSLRIIQLGPAEAQEWVTSVKKKKISIPFDFQKIFGPILLMDGSLKHNVAKVFLKSHFTHSQKLFDPIVLINWRSETQCNHSIFEILFEFWIFTKYLTPLCIWKSQVQWGKIVFEAWWSRTKFVRDECCLGKV